MYNDIFGILEHNEGKALIGVDDVTKRLYKRRIASTSVLAQRHTYTDNFDIYLSIPLINVYDNKFIVNTDIVIISYFLFGDSKEHSFVCKVRRNVVTREFILCAIGLNGVFASLPEDIIELVKIYVSRSL